MYFDLKKTCLPLIFCVAPWSDLAFCWLRHLTQSPLFSILSPDAINRELIAHVFIVWHAACMLRALFDSLGLQLQHLLLYDSFVVYV